MPTIYEYRGVNTATGRRERGTLVSAGTDTDVFKELMAKGIEAPFIRPYNAASSVIGKRVRVRVADHLHFFESMAFLKTLVLSRAVRICAERAPNRRFATTLHIVARDVADGMELHAAMAKHPRDFTQLMIALVHAAQQATSGEEVYQNIAEMLEFEYTTKTDISEGLRGPLLLSAFGLGAVVVMFVFFVPRIKTMLTAFKVPMPTITEIIMNVGSFLATPTPWLVLLITLLVGGSAFAVGMRNVRFALMVNHFTRRLKPIGPLLDKRDTAIIARMLAQILKTVNLSDAVALLVPMARTTLHRLALEEVVALVRDGVELHDAFDQAGGFDQLFVSYLAIGAESTDRPGACLRVATFLEREFRRGVKSLTSKIDPVVSTAVTALFLTVALGLYTAYLQMISQALNNF